MKTLIQSIFAIALFAVILSGCGMQAPHLDTSAASYGPLFRTFTAFNDTITTSGTADTTIVTVGTFNRAMSINIQVSTDSLSGTTNAAAYLQQRLGANNTWKTLDTVTIDGDAINDFLTSDVTGGSYRVYIISNGTAQSNIVTVDGHAVERKLN